MCNSSLRSNCILQTDWTRLRIAHMTSRAAFGCASKTTRVTWAWASYCMFVHLSALFFCFKAILYFICEWFFAVWSSSQQLVFVLAFLSYWSIPRVHVGCGHIDLLGRSRMCSFSLVKIEPTPYWRKKNCRCTRSAGVARMSAAMALRRRRPQRTRWPLCVGGVDTIPPPKKAGKQHPNNCKLNKCSPMKFGLFSLTHSLHHAMHESVEMSGCHDERIET